MVICPYCNELAVLVTGKAIYPDKSDLFEKKFWSCSPCNAYVGCHPNNFPLGQLANEPLRKLRKQAHSAFDPLWQNGPMSRAEAYIWLSQQLGVVNCHIGSSDIFLCKRIIQACPSNLIDESDQIL